MKTYLFPIVSSSEAACNISEVL